MNPSQVPQIVVSSPIKGFKGFARLERNPRSSRKKREGVHCSMIKLLLLLLLSKVRDSLRLLNISYTMLYYSHVWSESESNIRTNAAAADDVAAAADDDDRLVIPKVQPAIASSHMSGCDHRGKVCFSPMQVLKFYHCTLD